MRISDWSSDVCSSDLGFSEEDRTENVRRVAHVARLMADAGVVVLVPLISPYRSGRDEARAIYAEARLPFVEVYVDTPSELFTQIGRAHVCTPATHAQPTCRLLIHQ